MDTWKPTHRITCNPEGGETYTVDVMLTEPVSPDLDAPAYTREEWDAEASADWARNAAGEWLWRGQACVEGTTGTYSVKALREKPTAQATPTLSISPLGNGTHVKVWRDALPGDGLPHALDNREHELPEPTSDGLTHVKAGGWQTRKGITAHVYTLHEAPQLARHLEECEQADLACEARPAMSISARAERDALALIHPGLKPTA